MTSQYPDVNDIQFAGLLQVATAAADAQERHATALGKRKRNDENSIDHELRTQHVEEHTQTALPVQPTLRSVASVMFREPSEKCQKYSRPPLGKVFTDLKLAPEPFLKLQAAAKAFMLDPNHPERRAVVGHKKESVNNDVAKLKLWNCVENFLEMEQNGERYFGSEPVSTDSEGSQRTEFWPQHREKIVKLCMPLFRKMVTNERQRLYASETRKQQDATKPDKKKRQIDTPFQTHTSGSSMSVAGHSVATINTPQPADGAQHDQWAYNSLTSPESTEQPITVHINVVSKESDHRVRRVPRITITSDEASGLVAMYSAIQQRFDLGPYRQEGADGIPTLPCMQVLTAEALVSVYTDQEWQDILQHTRSCEWLDGEVRVILEL